MPIFHLRARTVSRASGASAAAAASYILRLAKFSKAGLDPCVFSHAGNMPAWSASPHQRLEYWRAADLHERANARLFKSIEFALPQELSHAQRVTLAREFCTRVALTNEGQRLPFLMAIHAGRNVNSHCHLMVSERVADGHDRTPELWFSRAALKGKKPKSGGARKTSDLKPREWLLATRELLAKITNEALAAAGFSARVDHRSLVAQGIDRAAGTHLGPAGVARLRRGVHSRRAEDLAQHQAAEQKAQQLMAELREEARAVELELANTLRSDPAPAPTNNSTTSMLARAQRGAREQQEAAKKPERKKANEFEFRP